MTDNLILYCGIGFGLLLLCIAALVVLGLVRKERASQAELQAPDPIIIDAGAHIGVMTTYSKTQDQKDALKDEIVRLKEIINQHDNQMAQMINEYSFEIERLKELVKPGNAIEADFGPQLDDDETIETTDFFDDDELLGLVEESDNETIETYEKESENNEPSEV